MSLVVFFLIKIEVFIICISTFIWIRVYKISKLSNTLTPFGRDGFVVEVLCLTHTPKSHLKQPYTLLTRDVGIDLSESCLAEAFGGARPNRDQVGGARMQVGKHMVCLVPQFGYSAPWAWNIDSGV